MYEQRRVTSTLLFTDPAGRHGAITLGDAPIEIGDPTARARVESRDHGYLVTALGPGTVTLNGTPLAAKELRHDDVIVCGSLRFHYVEQLETVPGPDFRVHPGYTSPASSPSDNYISTPTGPDASPPGFKPRR
jgi:hypothetical protein